MPPRPPTTAGDPAPQITQIGLVVSDLEATMEAYHRTLGWGPWAVYEHKPPQLHDLYLRGEPVEFSMLVAQTEVGSLNFELLQPLEGPSVYREWLEAGREGLHHVACKLPPGVEAESLQSRFRGAGIEPLASGRLGEELEFFYFETQPQLKMVIESSSGSSAQLAEPVRTFPE